MSDHHEAQRSAPQFTVFTPTFNGGHSLHRVYDSLREQTLRDFEWVIVDDGSTDGTREIVANWQQEAAFPIRYFYQENRGKHFAHNRAIREARGTYFVSIDGDDSFLPAALESFNRRLAAIPKDQQESYFGVDFLCVDQHGRPVGDDFPHNGMSYDYVELFFRYKFRCERFTCGRTAVFKQFPFPEVATRCWLSENCGLWLPIGERYKSLGFNDRLRVYYRNEGGSLSSIPGYRMSAGRRESEKIMLNGYLRHFRSDPMRFVQAAAIYTCHSFHLAVPVKQQVTQLLDWKARLLWLLTLPFAYVAFRAQNRRRRREDAARSRETGGAGQQCTART